MTKREEAAQLLAELKAMAGDNAVALALLQEESTKLEALGHPLNDHSNAKETPSDEFVFTLSVEAYLSYKAYDKSPERKLLVNEKVKLTDNTTINIPSHCELETYLWVKVELVDQGLWDKKHAAFIVNYTGISNVDKEGVFTVIDKYCKQLESEGVSEYTIRNDFYHPDGGKHLRLQIKGILPGKKEQHKHWTGGKDTEVVIPTGVVASSVLSVKFLPEPYVPQQLGSKELVFEKENQAVLSSDKREVCLEWWRQLKPELKEAIRSQKAKIVIRGYTSPPGSFEYNAALAEERARAVARILIPKIGSNIDGKPLAIIRIIGEGEDTDNPRRYVKIEVIEL